jgi:hypothetical protein
MSVALCIVIFALGHMFRDGWPALHTTHGARALGAVTCMLGAVFVAPYQAPIIGFGVWVGFYFDMKHGEGQGPDDSMGEIDHNLPFLALSGLTSLIPLTAAMVWFIGAHRWPLVFIGLAKPVIWPLCWYALPRSGLMRRWILNAAGESFFAPTRIAAMSFGAAIGAAVALGV